MKLFYSLCAFLLSISVFSQDLDSIKYKNSSFSLNGEIIEMRDLYMLTRSYTSGSENLKKGLKILSLKEYPILRLQRFVSGGVYVVSGPLLAVFGSVSLSGSVPRSQQFLAVTSGAAITGIGLGRVAESFSSSKKLQKRADKQLKKVADKLNEAIYRQGIEKLQRVQMPR